jgi:PAS domain S-box-containing protein
LNQPIQSQPIQSMIVNSPFAIAILDRELRYIAVSDVFKRFYGLQGELRGLRHYDVFPTLPETWRAANARALEGEITEEKEGVFIPKSGSPRWRHWQVAPWRAEDGSIGGIVISLDDLTPIKEREALAQSDRERYRTALEQATDAFFLVDSEGRFRDVNQCACESLQYSREELLQMGPADIMEDFDPVTRKALWASFVPGKPETINGYEIRRDGTRFPVEIRTGVVLINGERFYLSLSRDVSNRLRLESEARLWHRAFMQAEIGIAQWNAKDLTFQAVNPAFARERGYAPEELVGQPVSLIYPPERAHDFRERAQEANAAGGHATYEVVHVRKDGTQFPVLKDLTLMRDPAGVPVAALAFVVDLTNQKRAEKDLAQLNAQLELRVRQRTAELEAANKELEAFAYSVSHDLTAPLRGIDGWSLALVEDYGDQLDPSARLYLDQVRSEAQRMGRLIGDLLQLSRIGRLPMHMEEVDLTGLAQLVAGRLDRKGTSSNIQFSIAPGLRCSGDPSLLEIALTNLLENAAKYSGTRAQARIEVDSTETGGERVFFVKDNGVGFDMAYAGKLFTAFQRLHRPSDFPGTGIGLATVHRIIQRHGGRIWGEAAPDKGATFFFVLPEARS